MSLTSYRAAPSRANGRTRYREISVLTRFGGDLLSHVLRRSTIGAVALNGQVRNGGWVYCSRYDHQTKKAQKDAACILLQRHQSTWGQYLAFVLSRSRTLIVVYACDRTGWFVLVTNLAVTGSNQAYRTISTGQLNALLHLHLRPIDVVVFHGPQGYLVLRGASRLDAFSGYPVRT